MDRTTIGANGDETRENEMREGEGSGSTSADPFVRGPRGLRPQVWQTPVRSRSESSVEAATAAPSLEDRLGAAEGRKEARENEESGSMPADPFARRPRVLRSPVLQAPVQPRSKPPAEAATASPSLEDRLGAVEGSMEKGIQKMKRLIKEMLAALKKQPNISKVVKDGLPALEEALEGLEESRKEYTEACRSLPKKKPSAESTGTQTASDRAVGAEASALAGGKPGTSGPTTRSASTQTAPGGAAGGEALSLTEGNLRPRVAPPVPGGMAAGPTAGKRGATSPPPQPHGDQSKKRKEEQASTWTEVVRKGKGAAVEKQQEKGKETETKKEKKKKKKRKKKKATGTEEEPKAPTSAPASSAPGRPTAAGGKAKPEAILLKPAAGKTFADVLRTVRKAVNPESCGVKIRAVRQTRAGEVLLELGRSTLQSRAAFSDALKGAVGSSSSVRQLVPRATLEIRELDGCATREEVLESLRRDLKDYNGLLQVTLTSPNSRGQCLAIVDVEEVAAARLLKVGRIKVGWVEGKVRRRVVVPRCFKCLGYGHQSSACKGPDRSKLCYRCGGEGHNAKSCTAGPVCFLCPAVAGKAGLRQHVAGSGECGVFRKALEEAKRK